MSPSVWRFLKQLLKVVVALAVLFGLMQLIPYGRTHANPRVTEEPVWDSPRTRALAVRACFDCHSNESRWPWYADVAPMSWVVQHDVEAARDVINFSEWDRPFPLAKASNDSIKTGDMPPTKYRMAHPEADFTDAETRDLMHGLDLTFAKSPAR